MFSVNQLFKLQVLLRSFVHLLSYSLLFPSIVLLNIPFFHLSESYSSRVFLPVSKYFQGFFRFSIHQILLWLSVIFLLTRDSSTIFSIFLPNVWLFSGCFFRFLYKVNNWFFQHDLTLSPWEKKAHLTILFLIPCDLLSSKLLEFLF